MTTAPLGRAPLAVGAHRRLGTIPRVAVQLGLALAGLLVLQWFFRSAQTFPESWNLHLADPITDAQTWIRDHRTDHWIFTVIITPVSDWLDSTLASIEDFLLSLPWYVLPLLAGGIVARTRRYGSALFVVLCTLYPAAVGLWEATTETLALIIVSVALAVLVGTPLGIWSAQSRRVETVLRPVLDAMQVVPATVYLIPAVMVLGIGKVPAVAATFVYALPPMIRLTALGLKEVPKASVEAADLFGSSPAQSLLKVRIPLAMQSIITGVNQTIMMALGIVVIAGLVGAQGLGAEVLRTLQVRSPGEGMVVGLAIVAIALVLDRVSRALVVPPDQRIRLPRPVLVGIVVGLVAITVVGRRAGWTDIPVSWDTRFARPLDDAILWVRDHAGWLTRSFNDWFVEHVLVATRDFLTDTVAWPVLLVASALLGYAINGWRLALFTAVGVFATGCVGLWDESIQTLIQVVVCVIISMAIAIPLGIFVGRRARLEAALNPFLDALQTIPSLVYTIPFVMIFTVGQVPGLIATVLYAIPPGIRITALGIKQVNAETLEASATFGATPRQTLWGVRVPLALPTIMLAANQVIMMVMAMVIIIGLVGGGALGFEAVNALTRRQAGTGAEVAVAIVFMAMILDRMTEGIAQRVRPPAGI